MHLRCTGASVVWGVVRGGRTEPYFPDDDDGSIKIPFGLDGTPVSGSQPVHLKLTMLRWNARRYELIGGMVLALGLPGTTHLNPTVDATDDVQAWDLAAPPSRSQTSWSPRLLTKATEADQWHAGTTTPDTKCTVAVVGWSVYSVWDVSDVYARFAKTVIRDIEDRCLKVFKANTTAPLLKSVDCRGFIRQSELRCDFPMAAFPGNCIEETACNRITVAMWDKLVAVVSTMTALDADKLKTQMNMASLKPMTPVALNVMEALTSAVGGMSGAYVGYDNEQYDDTSVPWQKFGTNSDCEDFAIAAVGLYRWLKSPDNDFDRSAATWVGRALAKFVKTAFQWFKLVTGFATPQIARPDLKVTTDDLGGHGFVLGKRNMTVFEGYPTKYMVVEATAMMLSYRPLKPWQPKASMTTLCNESLGGIITLMIPSEDLLTKKSSIGCATLLSLDKNGLPYKYKVAATLSDAEDEVAVCVPGTKQVGVMMDDVMVGRFDTCPIASADATRVYDAHIRGFRMDTDFARIAEGVPAERRFKKDLGTTADDASKMYGIVAFTGDDINRTMGGRFVAPPSTATRVIRTTYGDLLLAGYPSAVVLELTAKPSVSSAMPPAAPELLTNKITRRLKRVPRRTTTTTLRLRTTSTMTPI